MRSSYSQEDVTLLLKDITGQVEPQSTEEREREIQGGRHYCEMLPMEYQPSAQYMDTYYNALGHYARETADAVGRLAHKLQEAYAEELVLVSLARAGTPVGVLLKRYIHWRFTRKLSHYSISIIRGRGIDTVAMAYILQRHSPESLVFVDGWTGKGAIYGELCKELTSYPQVSPQLAVLADPAHVASFYGTQRDILIPSACLNSTVSGLVSRTFLREDIISPTDFHGAVYYGELAEVDVSLSFLETVEGQFQRDYTPREELVLTGSALDEVEEIARDYGISNINLVKPGIGESTRVLLRRVPWKILLAEEGNPALAHIVQLARERGVPVEYRPMKHYVVCGLIRKMEDV